MRGTNSDPKHTVKHPGQQSKIYMEKVRNFIEAYKTSLCTLDKPHNENSCWDWHSVEEKRRSPYDGHTFLYTPIAQCQCKQEHKDNCEKCLNNMERTFHPISYKTEPCPNYFDCALGLFCPYLHEQDRYRFEYGEFFRFDLATFKTKPCPKRGNKGQSYDSHERRVCIYYHNSGDMRRENISEYTHVMCNDPKNCTQNCTFSHNQIEQLYHPSRYKSKFCKTYPNRVAKCDYRDFCSFTHVQSEITIQLIHLEDPTPDFHMYLYKTIWCPYTQNHDRATCVYAHNFQDFRRNPHEYKYKPEKCPYWNFKSDEIKSIQQAGCKNGMNCDKSHGWKEPMFHPQVYKRNKQKKQIESQQLMQTLASNDKSKLGQKFTAMYPVGSPFFKVDRQPSEASRKTKAKTINNTSDRSNESGSVKDREENKSEKLNQENRIVFTFLEEATLWENFYNQAPLMASKEESSRPKSLGKPEEYDVAYSKSIKDMLEETSILTKLKNKRIKEVKIINLKEKEIKSFEFLTSSEKQILTRKINEYSLKRDPKTINYSADLTKFFIRKRCERILQKMRVKKVKESKLLNLLSIEIKDMSFLSADEKDQLPGIIKEFSNDKEFAQLNRLINRETLNGPN